jgi:hypothetical protein
VITEVIPLTGPLNPFGSEVSYKSAVADPNTSHGDKFGASSRQGVMVGHFLNPGGARRKDYLVFDLDTSKQNKDARRIRVLHCGEVFQRRGLFMIAQIPLAPTAGHVGSGED